MRAVGIVGLAVLVEGKYLGRGIEAPRVVPLIGAALVAHEEQAGVAQRIRAAERPEIARLDEALGLLGHLEDDIARR